MDGTTNAYVSLARHRFCIHSVTWEPCSNFAITLESLNDLALLSGDGVQGVRGHILCMLEDMLFYHLSYHYPVVDVLWGGSADVEFVSPSKEQIVFLILPKLLFTKRHTYTHNHFNTYIMHPTNVINFNTPNSSTHTHTHFEMPFSWQRRTIRHLQEQNALLQMMIVIINNLKVIFQCNYLRCHCLFYFHWWRLANSSKIAGGVFNGL